MTLGRSSCTALGPVGDTTHRDPKDEPLVARALGVFSRRYCQTGVAGPATLAGRRLVNGAVDVASETRCAEHHER